MKNPTNPNSIARRRTYAASMEQLGLEPLFVQVDGEGWNLESIGYDGAIKGDRGARPAVEHGSLQQ